jgi:hypothetical protein
MLIRWQKNRNWKIPSALFAVAAFLISGCSLNRLAADALGDAISANRNVYAADNDPELIRQALPFGLKIFESLLDVTPNHQGLLLAASRGFAAYAFLVQNDSEHSSATPSSETHNRVRNLFLRGRDYALRGLGARHPNWVDQLNRNPRKALSRATKDDVALLYWAGVCWGGAIAAAKNDLKLIVDLPLAGALVQRVLELDEGYDFGAADEFFIAYEASRPGGSITRARQYYQRALELSGGQRASVHLALAEAVAVKEQNLAEFRALLALTITASQSDDPDFRLVNTIARQRALWLEQHIQDLFVDAPVPKENAG